VGDARDAQGVGTLREAQQRFSEFSRRVQL
jgi:hypothetical protein